MPSAHQLAGNVLTVANYSRRRIIVSPPDSSCAGADMTNMLIAVAKQLNRQVPDDHGLQELWQTIHAAVDEAGSDAATQVIKKNWTAKSEQLDRALASLKKLL